MAPTGYSGTPQARKLGLRTGARVALEHAPDGWQLSDPPEAIALVGPGESADLVVAFVRAAAELDARLPGLAERIRPDGIVWVAWPRKAAGHVSDLGDNVVRERALRLGLVDTKVAALDEDWSALRLVWRRELRS